MNGYPLFVGKIVIYQQYSFYYKKPKLSEVEKQLDKITRKKLLSPQFIQMTQIMIEIQTKQITQYLVNDNMEFHASLG